MDELVEGLLKETFERDYAMFRTPKWAKEHRITQEHLERIVVDPKEVGESAEAAKALVNTMLSRVLAGLKKGAIGSKASTSSPQTTRAKAVPAAVEEADAQQPGSEEGTSATVNIDAEDDLEFDAELDEYIWQDDNYSMDWKSLLDYLQSTAGNSKTAQWRNWHLLNAIAKTRQRCEELFGHETR